MEKGEREEREGYANISAKFTPMLSVKLLMYLTRCES